MKYFIQHPELLDQIAKRGDELFEQCRVAVLKGQDKDKLKQEVLKLKGKKGDRLQALATKMIFSAEAIADLNARMRSDMIMNQLESERQRIQWYSQAHEKFFGAELSRRSSEGWMNGIQATVKELSALA